MMPHRRHGCIPRLYRPMLLSLLKAQGFNLHVPLLEHLLHLSDLVAGFGKLADEVGDTTHVDGRC